MGNLGFAPGWPPPGRNLGYVPGWHCPFIDTYRASEITARAMFQTLTFRPLWTIKLDRTIMDLHKGHVLYDGHNGQANDRS